MTSSLRTVLTVMDRLPVAPGVPGSDLVDQVMQACEQEGQPRSRAVVEKIISDMQQAPFPASLSSHATGAWIRPRNAHERQFLMAHFKMSISRRTRSVVACFVGGVLTAGVALTLAGGWLEGLVGAAMLSLFLGMALTFTVDAACERETHDLRRLEEAKLDADNVRRWLSIPTCRSYLQAALNSGLPIMRGDLLHFKSLEYSHLKAMAPSLADFLSNASPCQLAGLAAGLVPMPTQWTQEPT